MQCVAQSSFYNSFMSGGSRCKTCWAQGPPHYWDRSQAPSIPETKKELLIALKQALPEKAAEWSGLLRDELRQYFRVHVRGDAHPADPLRRSVRLEHL